MRGIGCWAISFPSLLYLPLGPPLAEPLNPYPIAPVTGLSTVPIAPPATVTAPTAALPTAEVTPPIAPKVRIAPPANPVCWLFTHIPSWRCFSASTTAACWAAAAFWAPWSDCILAASTFACFLASLFVSTAANRGSFLALSWAIACASAGVGIDPLPTAPRDGVAGILSERTPISLNLAICAASLASLFPLFISSTNLSASRILLASSLDAFSLT